MPRADSSTYQKILAEASAGLSIDAEGQTAFAQKLLTGLHTHGVRSVLDAMASAGCDPEEAAEESEKAADAAPAAAATEQKVDPAA